MHERERLSGLPGFSLRFAAPTFAEIAVRVPGGDASRVAARAAERGVVPGAACGRFDPAFADTLLVSVAETHRKTDIDRLADVLAEVTR